MVGRANRNSVVEKAVDDAINSVDSFISGSKVIMPKSSHRRAIDNLISGRRASVRLATLFLLFYWKEDINWNKKDIPVGTRGKYGDKRLSEELSKRGVTLHDNITAFGENLGWKGNVREFDLSSDDRFSIFKEIGTLTNSEVDIIANYLAMRFAESQVITNPLPDIEDHILTFARANKLFHDLVIIPSEGHIQQFLVAAILHTHRKNFGYEIKTHHPHASDKYDSTSGDIEEFHEGRLIGSYEVTVRSDWENRISNFKDKMDQFGLSKYIIIASNISRDSQWGDPTKILTKIEPYGRDIAVVDINEFLNIFAAELSAREIKESINKTYKYLTDSKLCGRSEIITKFSNVMEYWLDDIN